MVAASRLGRQITEVIAVLEKARVPAALIGGLALAPHGVVRGTPGRGSAHGRELGRRPRSRVDQPGYHCLHRSPDAANYLRGDERLDLLDASRPVARRLLAAAQARATPFGALNVISLEGLIAFKLQGLINDPRRTQDLEDIRALLRANTETLNRDEVREYFRLFDEATGRLCSMNSSPKSTDSQGPAPRRHLLVASGGIRVLTPTMRDPFEALDDLMVVVEALCPTWPSRESFGTMPNLRPEPQGEGCRCNGWQLVRTNTDPCGDAGSDVHGYVHAGGHAQQRLAARRRLEVKPDVFCRG